MSGVLLLLVVGLLAVLLGCRTAVRGGVPRARARVERVLELKHVSDRSGHAVGADGARLHDARHVQARDLVHEPHRLELLLLFAHRVHHRVALALAFALHAARHRIHSAHEASRYE